MKEVKFGVKELHVENIKRIKVVDIKPEGNVVVVEGKNAQGKSSTLDAIAYALGGEKLIPKGVVRKGEEKAVIKVAVEGFVVTRYWTNPDRSYLKIETEDGMTPKSPQTFLDGKIGKIAFDPLKFLAMDREKKIRELKKVMELDIDDLEQKYNELYEKRREIKRDRDRVEKSYKEIQSGIPEDITEPKRGRKEVMEEIGKIVEWNSKVREERARIDIISDRIERNSEQITEIDRQIILLTKKKRKLEDDNWKMTLEKTQIEKSNKKEKETKELEGELEKIEQYMMAKEKIDMTKRLEKEKEKYDAVINAIEKEMSGMAKEKTARIMNAKVPIEGLKIEGNQILYNGVDFENLSSLSEKVKVSMAIAMAQNPELRIILIHDGSLLDKRSMGEVVKMAEEKDYQVWIEKVAEGKGSAVYIENGEIK